MHPKGQFCGGNAESGYWRECSVGGDVFGLRECRSAQQKGKQVTYSLQIYLPNYTYSTLVILLKVYEENNILQDGTLIDLCGATLLWRSADGLQNSPVNFWSFLTQFQSFRLTTKFISSANRINVIWKNWLIK